MARHTTPRNEITRLMLAHGLSAAQIADLAGRDISTVYGWMARGTRRPCPADVLELLRYRLGEYSHK